MIFVGCTCEIMCFWDVIRIPMMKHDGTINAPGGKKYCWRNEHEDRKHYTQVHLIVWVWNSDGLFGGWFALQVLTRNYFWLMTGSCAQPCRWDNARWTSSSVWRHQTWTTVHLVWDGLCWDLYHQVAFSKETLRRCIWQTVLLVLDSLGSIHFLQTQVRLEPAENYFWWLLLWSTQCGNCTWGRTWAEQVKFSWPKRGQQFTVNTFQHDCSCKTSVCCVRSVAAMGRHTQTISDLCKTQQSITF